MKFHLTYLVSIRYYLGAICLVSVWIFPFTEGSSRDALQQIYALGMLAAASLLFGLGKPPVVILKIVFLALVCMIIAPSPYIGGRVAGIAGVLLFGISCHFGATIKQKISSLKWLLIAILVAAVINAIEGLLQWLGLVGALYPWVVEPETNGIAFGAFRQRNNFATFLVVGVICTAWLNHIKKITEYLAWFLVSLLVFSLAASASRTGLLEVIAVAFGGWFSRKKQSKSVTRLLIGQAFVYFLATLILPIIGRLHGFGFATGVSRATVFGQDSRFVLWGNVIDMIRVRPWSGWGWLDLGYGHYATIFQERFDGILHHAHNLPLQIAVEFGVPVAIIVCTLMLLPVFFAYKNRKLKIALDVKSMPELSNQFAWLIVMVIVGIHSILELPLWSAGFIFLSGLSTGYLSSESEISKQQEPALLLTRRCSYLSAVFLMLLAIFAWGQYAEIIKISKIDFRNRDARRIAISSASESWLFSGHQEFAAIEFLEVTPQNSLEVRKSMEKLLHFSAEPRVIRPLLLSLWNLRDSEAFYFHALRFCIAFPDAFAKWRDENSLTPMKDYIENLAELEPTCGTSNSKQSNPN